MATVSRDCGVVSQTVRLFDRLGTPAMYMHRQISFQGTCNARHHERKGECSVRAPVQANIASSRSSGRVPDVSKSECVPDFSKRSCVCVPDVSRESSQRVPDVSIRKKLLMPDVSEKE